MSRVHRAQPKVRTTEAINEPIAIKRVLVTVAHVQANLVPELEQARRAPELQLLRVGEIAIEARVETIEAAVETTVVAATIVEETEAESHTDGMGTEAEEIPNQEISNRVGQHESILQNR